MPIKPVNKLINLRRRSNSTNQTKLNDESEKLTISKLFGVKFIENKTTSKPSYQRSATLSNRPLAAIMDSKKVVLSDEEENGVDDDDDIEKLEEENEDMFDDELIIESRRPKMMNTSVSSVAIAAKPVATVKKSHSTLSSDLKRRFLKFTKDKTAP